MSHAMPSQRRLFNSLIPWIVILTGRLYFEIQARMNKMDNYNTWNK